MLQKNMWIAFNKAWEHMNKKPKNTLSQWKTKTK